jgi:hypothetical protein
LPSTLVRRHLAGGLLTRLLDDPQLAPALRALPAPALRQVILRVGLEDAGELVALASLDQLREVFDEDLWRSTRPGQDEAFDSTRFVTWIEVLLEGGEAFVADRLAELSEDFLVFAVSQLVRVLDVAVLTVWASNPSEGDLLDRIVDTHLCHELDDFLLVSRIEEGWDALLTTLLALDERHPMVLGGVLQRCASATHEQLNSTGELHAALRGEDRLLEDARAEREVRRAGRGYVAPADARAFLALARTAPEVPEVDPITRAHFRELEPTAAPSQSGSAAAGLPKPPPLRELLAEVGVEPGSQAEPPVADSLFRETLGDLAESHPDAHQRIVEELAYLANVLVAGDTSAARSWRPVEAAERVLELCDEGLRETSGPRGSDPAPPKDALLRWGAIGLFRAAWASRSQAEDDA